MRGTEYIGIDDNGVEFEVKKPDFCDFTALCMSHPTWPGWEPCRFAEIKPKYEVEV
jgi:hypothetical protein